MRREAPENHVADVHRRAYFTEPARSQPVSIGTFRSYRWVDVRIGTHAHT